MVFQRVARRLVFSNSLAVWIVLFVGITLTWVGVSKVREIELREAEAGAEAQLSAAAEEINRRLQRIAVAVIGGSGMPDAEGRLNPEAWRRFVAPFRLPNVLDGVVGLGYAAFEVDAQGEQRAVVRAIESGAASIPPLLGVNMFDHIGIAEVIGSAVTVREPTLSARLVLPDRDRSVVLLVMPLYLGDDAPSNLHERRKDAAGVVFAIVPLDDLFRSMPNWIETDALFEVYDGPVMTHAESLIYRSNGEAGPIPANAHAHNVQVAFGGRIWRVQMSEVAGHATVESRSRSTLTLVAGILATLLLTWMSSYQGLLRRRAEGRALEMTATLRASEKKLNLITDNVDCGIIVVQDGKLLFMNPGALYLADTSLDKVLNTPFFELVHPDDRQMVLDRHMRRTRGEAVEKTYDFRILGVTGVMRWVEISAVAIEWEGRPATLSFLNEISWRKDLEEALQRKSLEQDAILQSSQVGICYTVDRRCEWLNRAFARQLGYEPDELIGVSARLFHADEVSWQALNAAARAAFDTGRSYVGEHQLLCKNGGTIWTQIAATMLDLAKPGRGAIWTVVDITARRKAEDDIRRALEQQRELNDLKGRFVAMTSHEFRTPLATILSSTDLIRHYGDRLPGDEKTQIFDSIDTAVKRMTKMLDDILTIGRADAGVTVLKPSLHKAVDLIRETALEAARASGPDAEARLDIVAAAGIELLQLDAAQVRHVVSNLVSNAYKYSPDGGRIAVHIGRADGMLEMQVVDQGIGIPPDDLPHLFDSFHRAANVANISGTGLGLAIVKRAVELHGGSIAVASAPGQGSRFTVRLPWTTQDADETARGD